MTDFTDDDLVLLRKFRQLAGRILADPTISVDSAAGVLGMSQRSMYRKFKELTGLTPAAYLREHRLERAKELLETGAVRSVDEAAFAVGIEDTAYFARLFYQRFRQRPSHLLLP